MNVIEKTIIQTPAQGGIPRRLPIGAEVQPQGGVHFRVWAPRSRSVSVHLEGGPAVGQALAQDLEPEADGYFAGFAPGAVAGMTYRFRLESGLFPDPASRFQPQGPHGPSEIMDPRTFPWTDRAWKGAPPQGQVIYELHVGTFTTEGTWQAARGQLPELAALGITIVELMPVADFSGRFGWGYDGVDFFAPTRLYGRPDDFRAFVNQAHALGIGVILDVVYNHFGPDGNYLNEFSSDYIGRRYRSEWGEAINFDGERSEPVREFFISNAIYWVDEFHLDGFRFDATHQIFDRSSEHILAAIARRVREAARGRSVYLAAESESQEARLARSPDRGGYGLDAVWNDDFHHSACVALTGQREAYFSDFKGSPQEMISAMKWGWLYQGQRYAWQEKRRGSPALDLDPFRFVVFLQNHDQVANSLRGYRLDKLAHPALFRALTALLLLAPGTPLLFQGQEFASSAPFLFFADHNPELARLVKEGRKEFLGQFPRISHPDSLAILAPPESEETFCRCKLDFSERQQHAGVYALHRDLLRLRREDPVFLRSQRLGLDGAVLAHNTFVLRYFGKSAGDRLLLINLGSDLHLDFAPEPLLAPQDNHLWKLTWSSEDTRYGGSGIPPVETEENWRLPAYSAIVMTPDFNPSELAAQRQTHKVRRTA